jgi:hypothetical protein
MARLAACNATTAELTDAVGDRSASTDDEIVSPGIRLHRKRVTPLPPETDGGHPAWALAFDVASGSTDRRSSKRVEPPPEDRAMAQGEETDGTPTVPDPVEGDESDPDKDASATPTDDAGDPQNADLNAGALSQPTTTGAP